MSIRPQVEEKNLHLEMHPMQVEHEDVLGDRKRLQQIFMNILGNSVKFTPPGGRLEISVVEHESREHGCCSYDFVFRDNGIGMEEEFIPHIFEPLRGCGCQPYRWCGAGDVYCSEYCPYDGRCHPCGKFSGGRLPVYGCHNIETAESGRTIPGRNGCG